jgi:hypothetical protein
VRCEGSHERHRLTFLPEAEFPGGVMCPHCGNGIRVVRSTIFPDKTDQYPTGEMMVHYLPPIPKARP